MSNRRQRFVFGIVATLLGAALFVVASSYLVFRTQPLWLAATVGALAFPVLPLAWQLIGERARRRNAAAAKPQAKQSLTAGDRYWLRFVGVTLLVLGPMVAIGKLDVARAAWKHGLWWWPASYEPSTTHGGPLAQLGTGTPRTLQVFGTPLARIPAEAELVVMAQPPPDAADQDGRVVFAYGNQQVLFVLDGTSLGGANKPDDVVRKLNEQRSKLPWLPTEEMRIVAHGDKQVVAASGGWASRVALPGMGPSAELLRELGRAPKDAFVVAGFVPKTTPEALVAKAGAVWIYQAGAKGNAKLVIEGRVEMRDEAAAKKLAADATRALDEATRAAPQHCREQIGTIVKAIQLDQSGPVITGRVSLEGAALFGVMMCAFDR